MIPNIEKHLLQSNAICLFLFQNVRKFLKEDIFDQMLPHVSNDRISLDVNPASQMALILNPTSKSGVYPMYIVFFHH